MYSPPFCLSTPKRHITSGVSEISKWNISRVVVAWKLQLASEWWTILWNGDLSVGGFKAPALLAMIYIGCWMDSSVVVFIEEAVRKWNSKEPCNTLALFNCEVQCLCSLRDSLTCRNFSNILHHPFPPLLASRKSHDSSTSRSTSRLLY